MWYRLNGDLNPLHVDPNLAELAGFEVPILHGLCTYGIITKVIMKELVPKILPKTKEFPLKFIRARFTSHVFPGETLLLNFWRTD